MSVGGGLTNSSGVSDSTSQRVASELKNQTATGGKSINIAGRDATGGGSDYSIYAMAGAVVVVAFLWYKGRKK